MCLTVFLKICIKGNFVKHVISNVFQLPFSYSWQNLKEAFNRVADVKYAAIKMENGKSKGCGMVVFNSNDDARRAVSILLIRLVILISHYANSTLKLMRSTYELQTS